MINFDWSDYAVFISMLAISILIGIYFGCFGSKQRSEDYLSTGKSMGAIPVGISLLASIISAVTLIGTPSEIYTESLDYYMNIYGSIIGGIISYYFFIPIFFELNVNMAYEYLELRFNKQIRQVIVACYIINNLIYMPMVIYVPSLILNLITDIDIHLIAMGTTAICMFYTMIGGLKAVIWTNLFQIVVAVVTCCVVVIIGTYNIGGLGHVLSLSYNDGKMNVFNMDPDPTVRMSFWSVIIGSATFTVSVSGFAQSSVQRYMSLKSYSKLPLTLFAYFAMNLVISTVLAYAGLLIYAAYYGCDPIKNKIISQPDQIFPYYVIDKLGYIPGLSGLFVAGIFGAALSSLSMGISTITQVIYNTYIEEKINPKYSLVVMMTITLFIGIFATASVYVVESLGKVLSSTMIITSAVSCPIQVAFTLGMMFPHTTTKGVAVGMAASFLFIAWVTLGNIFSKYNLILPLVYPIENEDCIGSNNTITSTIATETNTSNDIFPLYKISFLMYGFYGLVVGMFFGIITTFITGPTDLTMLDPKLISPPLRRFLPERKIENKPI